MASGRAILASWGGANRTTTTCQASRRRGYDAGSAPHSRQRGEKSHGRLQQVSLSQSRAAQQGAETQLQSLWVRFLEACFGFFGDGIVALMSDYRHKRHNVSALIYHIVCPAKYRRVIFDAEVDTVRKDVCLDIAKRYEIAF